VLVRADGAESSAGIFDLGARLVHRETNEALHIERSQRWPDHVLGAHI
jgi:hypothetical protein